MEQSDFVEYFVALEKDNLDNNFIKFQAENIGFGSYSIYSLAINNGSIFSEIVHTLTIENALLKIKNESLDGLEFITPDNLLICADTAFSGFVRFEVYFVYQNETIYPCKILYLK